LPDPGSRGVLPFTLGFELPALMFLRVGLVKVLDIKYYQTALSYFHFFEKRILLRTKKLFMVTSVLVQVANSSMISFFLESNELAK
jgi:hypothetical protein